MDRDEIAGWLRLAITDGVGNSTSRKLLAAFGLPPAVFGQPEDTLGYLVSLEQLRALREAPEGLAALVDETMQWLEAGPDRRILTLADAGYPQALLEMEDPPLMLYVMGRAIDAWPRAIAMVGSRNPTAQGLLNARAFAASFAQSGFTVVSGMALGIDGAAHEGSLDASGDEALATIAVVGTGLDRVYPKRHRDLAHRIAQHGLIVSEYHVGTPPLSQNFPRRNRIISALSLGTVVVEAALKSGSLITARMAAEQGRDVFAIPGSIHSEQSRGCHALIKQGAKLVDTAQDVLEELATPGIQRARPVAATRGCESDEAQDELPLEEIHAPHADPFVEALGYDPVSIDALVARTGMSASQLQTRLLELELSGDVSRLAGGLFQRVGAA